MKITLIQPPIQDFYDTEIRLQPLGLCYLKAALRRHIPGVDVKVVDYHQGWGRRTARLPAELAYLRDFYPSPDRSPFSTFHGYYHFGAPFETLAGEVAAARPDLVGISSLFSAYHREVLRCAEEIKRRASIPIVVGGAHATAAPLTLLDHPAVDFVILGEGERPFVEFVRTWVAGGSLERSPNLGFKVQGRPAFTPAEANYPLGDLPCPDFSDLDPARYRMGKLPLASLLASRGCPHACSFCSAHSVFGHGYRRRPVGDVCGEIRERYEEGYRAFDFEDDNLTLDPGEMEELCRRLAGEFPPGRLALYAMNGVSYVNLTPEVLELMKRAGFTQINLSLVTADEDVAQETRRPHSLARYLEVVGEAFRLGLRIVSYQILGLPGEPLESTLHTLAIAAELPVLLGASPFYLPPGAPMARDLSGRNAEGLVRCRLTAMGEGSDGAPPETIYTLFVLARVVNFLKGLQLGGSSVSLSEALDSARRSGGRAALGADLLARILLEGRLFAATRHGLEPLPRFDPEVFQRAWTRLRWITALDGSRILLG